MIEVDHPDPEEVALSTLTSFGLDDGDIKVLEEAGVNSLNRLLICNQQFLYGILQGSSAAKIDQICEAALKAFSQKKLDAVICSASCVGYFRNLPSDAIDHQLYLSYAECFAAFFSVHEIQVHMVVHHGITMEGSKMMCNAVLAKYSQTASAYKLVSEFSSHQMGQIKLEVEDCLSGKFLELIKKLDATGNIVATKEDFEYVNEHLQTVERTMISQSQLRDHQTFVSETFSTGLKEHTQKLGEIHKAMATKADIKAFDSFLRRKFQGSGSFGSSVGGTVSESLSGLYKKNIKSLLSSDLKALHSSAKSTVAALASVQEALNKQLHLQRMESVYGKREAKLREDMKKLTAENNLLELELKENNLKKNMLEAVDELIGGSHVKLLQAQVEQLQKELTGISAEVAEETKPQADLEVEVLKKKLNVSLSRFEGHKDELFVLKVGESLALEIASAATTELEEVKSTLEDLRLVGKSVVEMNNRMNKLMDEALARLNA